MEPFKSNENDSFSTLNRTDLRELLIYLSKYYITYRETIGLPDYITFGTEIEYEQESSDTIYKISKFMNRNYKLWEVKSDDSLKDGGDELASPILTDERSVWTDLKNICDYLKSEGCKADKYAGAHIHYGAMILENDFTKWKDFIKLYVPYEHILYRFAYGEMTSFRKDGYHFAYPTMDILKEIYNEYKKRSFSEFIRTFKSYDKYNGVNLVIREVGKKTIGPKDTIEFRNPNGTINPIVWQNNINAYGKLLKAIREEKLDRGFLTYKFERSSKSYKEIKFLYNEIDLKNVLEFVDLIFDNNLDKLNFLRQYIGDFRGMYEVERNVYKRKFTR